ncbi:TPA: hypothetical protein KDY89_002184 [Vibrio parahaemolyticus]|uniref:hypothetical protein n=1 Tax=Vibrio parahaemolyticus TaxID=670 RepID=UPI000D52F527|nr:hypothetical protein [Vibrio parahaemolyticus]AWG78392.1 hypothetical protein C9I78_06020 [Vibrio parahaemolyticus]AWJ78021.1 hypothetical protein C7Y67_06140 [Vibrio parahaemolyticus]HBC3472129.1 hypothetical protein [Vibrio parahaemolyticus]
MFEVLNFLEPHLPSITVGLAAWSLWNSIKTRKQSNELKRQDLALKRLEREDRFRYFPPHVRVDIESGFPPGYPEAEPNSCQLVVVNRDQRDIQVDSIEWCYDSGFSWPIESISHSPSVLHTAESLEFPIESGHDIFRFSSSDTRTMIRNILGLRIKVKLSTDRGKIYPITDYKFKRHLIYKNVDSFVMRKYGDYHICREYNIPLINLFI